MARELSEELNELKVQDNISNSSIVLYYRTPTTEENIQYTNESIVRRRNKITSRLGEARQKFGLKILEGFRAGDFTKKIDGRSVPLASDPKSNEYDPEWKILIAKHAPDIIEILAIHAFENAAETADVEEDVDDDKQWPDDVIEKNS
ncbi:MAG: hypothetical protein SV375_00135 [Thermodesulfobacteriota bacterium]|nr:hypothetical protein [Thermodesulfobacteriota bacterium]